MVIKKILGKNIYWLYGKLLNSDGECLKYLHTSIKNKFHELYRKQKIHRDNEVKNVGELFWDFLESSENQYSYIICVESVHQILNLNSKKRV